MEMWLLGRDMTVEFDGRSQQKLAGSLQLGLWVQFGDERLANPHYFLI